MDLLSSSIRLWYQHVLPRVNWRTGVFVVMAAWAGWMSLILQLATLNIPYWFDEANTVHHVLGNLPRLLVYAGNDNQAPLYYLLLWPWVALLGTSPAVTGALSLLINLATTAVTFRLAKAVTHQSATGWLAALLYWVGYTSVYFSTETRMYPLLALLVAASTLALWHFLQSGSRRAWAGYVLTAVLGVYTHYFFFFLLCAHNLAMLLRRRRLPFAFGQWVTAQVLIAVAFLPWAPFLVQRVRFVWLSGVGTWLDHAPDFSLGGMLLAVVRLQFPTGLLYSAVEAVAIFLILAVAVMGATKVQVTIGRWGIRLTWGQQQGGMLLLAVSLVVPVLVMFGFGLTYPRYLAFLAPLLACLLAAGVRQLQPVRVQPVVALAVIVASVGTMWVYFRVEPASHYRYHWVPVIQRLQRLEVLTPNAVVLLPAAEEEFLFRYYYRGQLPVVAFVPSALRQSNDVELDVIRHIGTSYLTPAAVAEIAPLIARYSSVWVLSGLSATNIDPDNLVHAWFAKYCELVDLYTHPSQVGLVRYTACAIKSTSPE